MSFPTAVVLREVGLRDGLQILPRVVPTATKLEIATAAMEITGCVTSTARDARLDAWQIAPTAATCLDAPERPAKP